VLIISKPGLGKSNGCPGEPHGEQPAHLPAGGPPGQRHRHRRVVRSGDRPPAVDIDTSRIRAGDPRFLAAVMIAAWSDPRATVEDGPCSTAERACAPGPFTNVIAATTLRAIARRWLDLHAENKTLMTLSREFLVWWRPP
jgi:hypothetical protein